MSTTAPVIAVIHATPASMAPVDQAFDQQYPSAAVWHLLDDRLVKDAASAGGLTGELHRRMTALIDYAVGAGADAVQLACSMYGPVAVASSHPLPVVASDQAMFDEVARLSPSRVVVLASLPPAADDSVERLTESLAQAGQAPEVTSRVVDGAADAALADDVDLLVDLLSGAVADLDADVAVLAQYSLAAAAEEVGRRASFPVLSGPHLAAAALERLLSER